METYIVGFFLVFSIYLFITMLFSCFQHFSLAVAPEDNGPQHPLDGLHLHNTQALQQTGVYTEHPPSNINVLFCFGEM